MVGLGVQTKNDVKLSEKYLLTVDESTKYFGIGENKIRELIDMDQTFDFTVLNGNRKLIKRKKFETWLDSQSIL